MNAGPTFQKTRIAPTPSGYLHLGNVLSFSITAALARKTNARILLRIDDLDRERVEGAYVQDIFDTLNFMEIPWEEGPRDYVAYEREYSQIHRLPLYFNALEELKRAGLLFACDCSRGPYPGTCRSRNLSFETPDTSWRLRTEEQAGLPASMKDFIVRKKDGYPAYQLTSVVDDQYFGIDLIVRGEDLRPSTAAQVYLSRLLRDNHFAEAAFHHHLLLESGDHKLSKSKGSTSIQFLRKEGKKKEDIYTLIGQQLGCQDPVSNYKELAALIPHPDENIL